MANYSAPANATHAPPFPDEEAASHTVTFVIGFGVLMLFLVMGIAASAFLCTTLKKDPYLWPPEAEKPTSEEPPSGTSRCEETVGLECTQI